MRFETIYTPILDADPPTNPPTTPTKTFSTFSVHCFVIIEFVAPPINEPTLLETAPLNAATPKSLSFTSSPFTFF